jgi:hypothetical protein
MNILALYQTGSGCCYHRVYNPLRYLPMQEGDSLVTISNTSSLYEGQFEQADIVFFNRLPHFLSNEKLFELKAKYGFKLVVDIDDFWRLYDHHILYSNWAENNVSARIEECLTFANVITTTNNALATKAKELNSNVEVVPNALPFGEGQFDYTPIKHTSINVLYAGGSSHLHDLKSIGLFFRRLGIDEEFLEKGKFIFAGYNNNENSKDSVYSKMYNVIEPIRKFQLKPPLSIHNYMDHYDHADISIAPLELNSFNLFKSQLKTIEAACKKIPILTSANLPYKIDDGIQGLTLCQFPSDFIKKVKYYLQNPLKIQEDGVALYEAIKEKYDFQKINKNRYDIFKHYAEL